MKTDATDAERPKKEALEKLDDTLANTSFHAFQNAWPTYGITLLGMVGVYFNAMTVAEKPNFATTLIALSNITAIACWLAACWLIQRRNHGKLQADFREPIAIFLGTSLSICASFYSRFLLLQEKAEG